MTENWRPIAGFENRYEVSDQGRVRSLTRTIYYLRKRNGVERQVSLKLAGRILKTPLTCYGYKQVLLGRGVFRFVHLLVLEAFVGPRPSERHEGCHNNGKPPDCRRGNLRWDTSKGNHGDKRKHGTLLHGEKANGVKLTAKQVASIKKDPRSQRKIAADFSVTHATIGKIKRGQTWNGGA